MHSIVLPRVVTTRETCRGVATSGNAELAQNAGLELLRRRAADIPRMREWHLEDRLDRARAAGQHEDAVGYVDRLFDVVRDEHAGVPLLLEHAQQLDAHA